MNDIAGLLLASFRLAHEISEASLDIENCPTLKRRAYYGNRIANSAVAALAHVAAASADYADPSFSVRIHVPERLREAREELVRLAGTLKTVVGQRHVEPEQARLLFTRIDELSALLMAIGLQLRGQRRLLEAG